MDCVVCKQESDKDNSSDKKEGRLSTRFQTASLHDLKTAKTLHPTVGFLSVVFTCSALACCCLQLPCSDKGAHTFASQSLRGLALTRRRQKVCVIIPSRFNNHTWKQVHLGLKSVSVVYLQHSHESEQAHLRTSAGAAAAHGSSRVTRSRDCCIGPQHARELHTDV